VEAVGREVTEFAPGDRVLVYPVPTDGTCSYCRDGAWPCASGAGAFGYGPGFWPFGGEVEGCQSEYLRVPFAHSTLTRMPEAVAGPEHEHAMLTCIDNFNTAWHGCVRARLEAGQNVLVIGDGGVGLCAAHAAWAKGAEHVICVGHHEDRLRVASQMGATTVLNSRDRDEIHERVMELTGGEGVHVVVSTISGDEPMALSQACVRHCGTISCIGMEQFVGNVPGVDWVDQWVRNVTITGGIQLPVHVPDCAALVAEGKIDPSPIFTHTLPLDQAAEGYRLMDERVDGVIKVALSPGG
jgi:threonine dehydrogenase-like Zn-dependent dehydrogenase